MEMAPCRTCKGEASVSRVEGVVNIQRRAWIGGAWHAFAGLIQQPWTRNRPAHAVLRIVNWLRLCSEELTEERAKTCCWAAGLTTGNRRECLLLLLGGALVGDKAD
jgi:hypothetical protein